MLFFRQTMLCENYALSIRKNREKWLKVFYILRVKIRNFQQEINFLHWPHSELYFFPFKSPIYIFFVHGAVLHEEFLILVYDGYWAYPQCPSSLPFIPLLFLLVSWSPMQLYLCPHYVCFWLLPIYADLSLRPGIWRLNRMGRLQSNAVVIGFSVLLYANVT